MNLSGRLTRAEKAIGPAAKGGPARITALSRYLQTGAAADIPEDVKFPELRAAARRIPKGAAAGSRGLTTIRAALGDHLPAGVNVQAFIESNPPPITRAYHLKDDEDKPEDGAADLLGRLGFTIIRINIIKTVVPREREEKGQG